MRHVTGTVTASTSTAAAEYVTQRIDRAATGVGAGASGSNAAASRRTTARPLYVSAHCAQLTTCAISRRRSSSVASLENTRSHAASSGCDAPLAECESALRYRRRRGSSDASLLMHASLAKSAAQIRHAPCNQMARALVRPVEHLHDLGDGETRQVRADGQLALCLERVETRHQRLPALFVVEVSMRIAPGGRLHQSFIVERG